MKFYAHRGNVNGPNVSRENSPEYVDTAIRAGFKVEVDLRIVGNGLYLGHDYPQYLVDADWLDDRKSSLLIHAKSTKAAMTVLKMGRDWHWFSHSGDPCALTSRGCLWMHRLSVEPDLTCIVPLLTPELLANYPYREVHGICTDYVHMAREKFE